MRTIKIIFILLCLSAMKSQAQPQANPVGCEEDIIVSNLKGYYSQVIGVSSEYIMNTDLYVAVENLLGTPYKYAGTTAKGIDCSAFVKRVYEKAYCLLLSGNSYSLYKESKPVNKNNLHEGDLVFFKTNRNKTISHVGVYLGNDKFAHASRSNGVIISDLQSPYYNKSFVRGGRLDINVD